MTKKIFLYVSIFLMLFSIVGISYFSLNTKNVLAATPPRVLSGYAWSSTIGWISMNCSQQNTDTCSTSNYAVNVDPTTGAMTGYAWSSNIGWIKFGGLGTTPDEPGNGGGDARLVGGTTFEGWARACAGTALGNCSTTNSRTDGWDGWISLKGDTHTITVTTNAGPSLYSKLLQGYAWGDVNVGWIDMGGVSISNNLPSTPQKVTAVAVGTCGRIDVSWDPVTSTNGTVTYKVIRVQDGAPILIGSSPYPNINGANGASYSYTVSAQDDIGLSLPSDATPLIKFVTCPQPPSIGSFDASPSSITTGGECTLNWTAITNVDPADSTRTPRDSCVITGNGGASFTPNGYTVLPNTYNAGSITTGPLSNEERFTITCKNGTAPDKVKQAKCNVQGTIQEI